MPVANGNPAPGFSLPDAANEAQYSTDCALKRGPLLIAIYKSSCEASKTMFQMLEALGAAYPEDRFTLFGVAQDSANVTRSFIRRVGVSFPMLIEGEEYPVSSAYDIEETPTVFLFDTTGTIIWQTSGFQLDAIEEVSGKIAELLYTSPADVTASATDIPQLVPG